MAKNNKNPFGGNAALSSRSRLLCEYIARIKVAYPHFTEAQVANYLHITPGTLSHLKKSQEYRDIEGRVATKILAPLDIVLLQSVETRAKFLAGLVPQALAVIQDGLFSHDDKVKQWAVEQVLDRDGHHSKVSRAGIALPEQGGAAGELDNEVANALVTALSSMSLGSSSTNAKAVNSSSGAKLPNKASNVVPVQGGQAAVTQDATKPKNAFS